MDCGQVWGILNPPFSPFETPLRAKVGLILSTIVDCR